MIKKGNRANDFPKKHLSIFFNLKTYKSMKKNKPFGELFYRSLKKTLLIMRIAVILMILGILQARANRRLFAENKAFTQFFRYRSCQGT